MPSKFLQILFLLIILHWLGFSIAAKEIQVCRNCPVATIKKGLELANSGDILKLGSETFKEESLVISKKVTIVGSDATVVDGNKAKHVLDVVADGVTIRNLTITGSGISDITEFAGIHAERVKDCFFENNKFTDNTYAIYLAEVNHCTVKGNSSIGNATNEVSGGNGIHLWSSSNIKILNNTMEKHRDGIYLEFSNLLFIEGNRSQKNIRYGMHFMFSSENKFMSNIFENNSAGVAVMYSKNILVEKNVFKDNWGESSNGILLKDISDSIFMKNKFKGNTTAIFADGSNNNSFIQNDIIDNGWGLKILGNSDYNSIKENNFIKNVFDVSTNSKTTTNVLFENYWDQYKGYDLNKNSRGDVPHKPIHFFGYWIAVYPFLMVLYESPIVLFLQGIEKAFPIVTPIEFKDKSPRMSEML